LIEKATSSNTSTLSVVAIGTTAQLNILNSKSDGDVYIVTDGSNTGDFALWNCTDPAVIATCSWSYVSPTDGTERNVLTNVTGNPSGSYTYVLATDVWTKTSDLAQVVPDNPTAINGVLFAKRYLAPLSNNAGIFILGDSVAGFGRSQSLATDAGSIVASTNNSIDTTAGNVRKVSSTWYQLDTPYTQNTTSYPYATDVQANSAGAVMIDNNGVLNYKGTAAFMNAITGLDSGASSVITSAYIPDKFWVNRTVRVVSYWLSYATNNIIALAGDGTIWVKGASGANNIYGDNTVTVTDTWHQVAVPKKQYKKIYINATATAAYALAADGSLYAWGNNAGNRFSAGSVGLLNPAVIATGIKDFDADADSTMLITSSGTRLAIGANTNGKLGNGTVTAVTTYTTMTSSGFTYDKVYGTDGLTLNSYHYVTTDKKAVMTGNQNLNRAISGATAASNVVFPTLMGNGAFQGSVSDIRPYTNSTLILTTQGTVWTAVNSVGTAN
jgi:hypothetical protein